MSFPVTTQMPTAASFMELSLSQHGEGEKVQLRIGTLAPAKFWRTWNHPVRVVDWCITVPDRNGNPYTVKWWSVSYRSNGVGRVTDTCALVAEGIHPHSGADGASFRYSLGHLPNSADVPQVKAAIRLLTHDGQPLAAFDERDRCISAGAYLDPRRETGEVVLGFCREHRATTVDAAEEERTVTENADLFRVAGWTVQEFRERDHTGREPLVRLILTPPLRTAWGG